MLVLEDKEGINYRYDLGKDIVYNLNNNIVNDKMKKKELTSQITQNLKLESDNISLFRDIFIQYSYLKKINEYVGKK